MTINTNAKINIDVNTLTQLVREHIQKVAGVERITLVKFNCDTENELPFLTDVDVHVVLKTS